MEKFLHLLLFLHPFVLPASASCIGVGTGCRRNGLIFGGRLMFSGNVGTNLPDLSGNSVFIFQRPPQMRSFLRPSAGRGQIWIGRSSCAGTIPGHCPSTEQPPCLDASPPCPGPPCSFDLNVDEKNVLTFTWERPTCVPEDEPLTYNYTSWIDGTTRTGTTEMKREIFDSFYTGSKYYFEVHVTTSKGTFSNYTSKASPEYTDNTPLTFSDVTTTGVTVKWPVWNAVSDKGRGPIAEYIIQYRLKGNSEFQRISKGLNYQHRFEGLTIGRTYEFQVIIVKRDPTEEGEPSAIQEKRTLCPDPTVSGLSLDSDYSPSDNSVGIYASWSVRVSTVCAARLNQTLTVQLSNRDSCDMSNQMTFHRILLGGDVRDYTLRNTPPIFPNSWYDITIESTSGASVDTETIRTAEAVPTQPPVLSAPVVMPMQTPLIMFNWEKPPCGSRNGNITNYEYRYRVWREGSTQTQPEIFDGTANLTVTLRYYPDSRYTFSVRAQTAQGPGDTDTFAVIDPPSYRDDTPLTFYDVTSSSISVRWPAWDENVDFGQGPVADYILLYRLQSSGSDFTEVNKGSALSHQLATNVADGGLYEFRIKLVKNDPRVEGRLSSIQQSIACEGLGDLVPQLSSVRLHPGNVSLDVSWAIPSSACDVTGQSLVIQQLDNDGCDYTGNEKTTALEASHRSYSFTGMQPYTYYNVTLKMQTARGLFSVSEKMKTAETEPTGTPLNLLDKKGVGVITFTWDRPQCGEGNGDLKYYYYYTRNGNVEEGNTGTDTRKPKMGINEGDEYSFKVLAYTGGGRGDYSSELKGTFSL